MTEEEIKNLISEVDETIATWEQATRREMMSEKYQIRGSFRHVFGSFRHGVKQYFVVDTQRTGMQVGLGEITHDPMQEHEAKFICAKLNRLAALEAVCEEIVESAPQKDVFGWNPQGDPEDAFYDGESRAEFQIAQKLKVVLEKS